jgi:hypothetical protein
MMAGSKEAGISCFAEDFKDTAMIYEPTETKPFWFASLGGLLLPCHSLYFIL